MQIPISIDFEQSISDLGAMRQASSTDEPEALQRFLESGCEHAFGSLVRDHLDRVRSVIHHIVLDPTDTDDLTQETFVAAHESIRRFRGESSFSTWLCGIAVKKSLKFLRSAKRREKRNRQAFQAEGATPPDEILAANERIQLLDSAIRQLPDKLRATLMLCTIEELPPDEVAEICGCTRATVYWRLHQARKQLKSSLNEDE